MKLSQIAADPHKTRKFNPTKVKAYTVILTTYVHTYVLYNHLLYFAMYIWVPCGVCTYGPLCQRYTVTPMTHAYVHTCRYVRRPNVPCGNCTVNSLWLCERAHIHNYICMYVCTYVCHTCKCPCTHMYVRTYIVCKLHSTVRWQHHSTLHPH